ncbi:dTDP-4-dehydrorhamnose 3,5-epimerase family protein [Empedobacter falsenii]
MKATETKLKGCFILEPTVFEDSRGYFFESYNEGKLEEILGYKPHFVQDNQSRSSYGVVRGLHMQAGQFVQVIEERQGMKIGAIEEVAYRMGYITKEELMNIAEPLKKSGYGEYLMKIIK